MTAIDSRKLRDVLGCYATGIAVIAIRTAGGAHAAVTVNSFASVSLNPALILFSLGNAAHILAHFQSAGSFTVNILSHEQESLANTFARPSSASWDRIAYSEGENGCALMSHAIAQLECSRHAEVDGGDHRIFIGEVTRIHLGQLTDPLLFYRGRFGTYVRSQTDKLPLPDSSLSEFAVIGWG